MIKTKEELMRKLDVNDYDDISQDKMKNLAECYNDCSPTVRGDICNNFDVIAPVLNGAFSSIKACIDSNRHNTDALNANYTSSLNEIHRLQNKDDLSEDEKKRLIEAELEILKMQKETDLDNKKFLATIAQTALGVLGVAVSSLIGAKAYKDAHRPWYDKLLGRK